MSYANQAGIDVSNHYGPRTTGGTAGVTKTAGATFEFFKNLDVVGPLPNFPVPKTGADSYWVTEVDKTAVDGTVTVETIGGVNVAAATPEAPVEIPAGNTGVIVLTGATGGTVLIKYKKYPL